MSTIKVEIPANRPDLAKIAADLFTAAAIPGDYQPAAKPTLEDNSGAVIEPPQSAGEQLIGDLDQGAAPAATTAPEVDMHGVAFNPEFCGKAAKPFYASGPRSGQWKKRQGVDQDDYDAWYKAERGAIAPAVTVAEPAPVNTQTAFSAPAAAPVESQQAPVVPAEPAPTDCGTFMAWISKKQAAGILSQEDIGNAYAQVGIEDVMQLFPPTPAETIQQNVANLYNILVQKAGA